MPFSQKCLKFVPSPANLTCHPASYPNKTIGTLDRVAHIMHEEELRKAVSLKEKRHQGKDSSAKDGGLFGIFHRHSKRELELLCNLKHLSLSPQQIVWSLRLLILNKSCTRSKKSLTRLFPTQRRSPPLWTPYYQSLLYSVNNINNLPHVFKHFSISMAPLGLFHRCLQPRRRKQKSL